MTAKSRRRKLHKKLQDIQDASRVYRFNHGAHDVSVRAATEDHARQLFQERFGYLPDAN